VAEIGAIIGYNPSQRSLARSFGNEVRFGSPPETKQYGATMLILTRRVGETLMIGDEVTVTVLGVKGNQVRIGVNAPKEVAVHREEIYERIKREQATAHAAPAADTGDLEDDDLDVAQTDANNVGNV